MRKLGIRRERRLGTAFQVSDYEWRGPRHVNLSVSLMQNAPKGTTFLC